MTPEECRAEALRLLQDAFDPAEDASPEWRLRAVTAAQAYATLAGPSAPEAPLAQVLEEILHAAKLAGFDATSDEPLLDLSQWLIQEVMPAVAAALREWNLADNPQHGRFTMARVLDSMGNQDDPYVALVEKILELAREHG